MSNEIQTTEQKKSAISITAFQGSRALAFNTLTEIHSFSEMVCKTELAPKAYRGKPQDATIAIIYGMEIGLPPMASLQNIAVVNGSPAVYGDGQLSLVQASGKYEWHKSSYSGTFPNDDFTATFEVKRIGATESVTKEYSIADAKRAGLWGKAGTWTTNPKLMLLYKPKSYALREAFADILKGMKSSEELEGEQIVDVTPKSKTAAAHASLPPRNIEESFQVEPVQTDIEEVVAKVSNSDTPTSDTEAVYNRISKELSSLLNSGGVKRYMANEAENMAYLKENAKELYDNILVIEKRKLEVVDGK